jgi:hypothetical protein
MTGAQSAFTLEIAPSMGDDDPLVVGYFASPQEAGDHYDTRSDLGAYFWRVGNGTLSRDESLPRVVWPPERVARARQERGL